MNMENTLENKRILNAKLREKFNNFSFCKLIYNDSKKYNIDELEIWFNKGSNNLSKFDVSDVISNLNMFDHLKDFKRYDIVESKTNMYCIVYHNNIDFAR